MDGRIRREAAVSYIAADQFRAPVCDTRENDIALTALA
jgi:hypothetical protein